MARTGHRITSTARRSLSRKSIVSAPSTARQRWRSRFACVESEKLQLASSMILLFSSTSQPTRVTPPSIQMRHANQSCSWCFMFLRGIPFLGTTVRCSVPEILIGPIGAGPRSLIFKTIRPSLYEWYGPTTKTFNSIFTGTFAFPVTAYSSPTPVSVIHNPSAMYTTRTTSEFFVGYYDV